MTRTVALVLLLLLWVTTPPTPPAVAAPVPKTTQKLEEVFGEVADKKSECKFEMGKGGVLTVTVPTTHPTLEPSTASTTPPMVGKQVDGDFVLTVRVALALPKKADGKGHTFLPAVMAGVSVVSADDPTTGVTIGSVRRLKAGDWTGADFLSLREPGQGGATEGEGKAKPGDPTWFRVTRRGTAVEVEASGDGTTWATFTITKVNAWGDAVSVGPVAFGCIDQEFTATFDRYEIKPLKEKK